MEHLSNQLSGLKIDSEPRSVSSHRSDASDFDAYDPRKFFYITERIVEAIYAQRLSPNSAKSDLASGSIPESQSFEYLVKFQHVSHLHDAWVPETKLKEDPKTAQLLLDFLRRQNGELIYHHQEPKIERLIAHHIIEDGQRFFLVKWANESHSSCTWEHENDITDASFIAKYESLLNSAAPDTHWTRPDASLFKMTSRVDYGNGRQLRPYQLEGVNFLRYCWYHQRNSILADEMGLGKTIQAVCTLDSLVKNEKLAGPFLIVAPLSTIAAWRREFELWTDLNVLLYVGDSPSREILRHYEFFHSHDDNSPSGKRPKFQVLIVSFEMLVKDAEFLRPFSWSYVVVDECHRLKSKDSRLLNEFKSFKYDQLLLITGTPLQNNLAELWTLLNLLDSAQFSSFDEFNAKFGNLQTAEQVESLRSILASRFLRRLKHDIVAASTQPSQPPPETLIRVPLTETQEKYYRIIAEQNSDALQQLQSTTVPNVLMAIFELRKCCNHPYLLRGVEEQEVSGLEQFAAEISRRLIDVCGKMRFLEKFIGSLQARNVHRVIILSQMARMLDLLDDMLRNLGIDLATYRIDGSTAGADRQIISQTFSGQTSGLHVLLLSSRGGAVTGPTPTADVIIVYDCDWYSEVRDTDYLHRAAPQAQIYRLLSQDPQQCELWRPEPSKSN